MNLCPPLVDERMRPRVRVRLCVRACACASAGSASDLTSWVWVKPMLLRRWIRRCGGRKRREEMRA